MRLAFFLLTSAILCIERAGALVRPRYYCPPDFIRLGNGCYHFSSHIASWQNAHFSCRDHGAQLISLDSRWEDSTIRTYLSRPEFARLERWVGGRYDWNRQQWIWGSTGQPITYAGFGELTITNPQEWHCVYMDPEQALKWNHKLCTQLLHYICEVPLVRATQAPPTN